MLVDINSGVIFWLLPLDGLFMAISMYNLEHVSLTTFEGFFLNNKLNLIPSLVGFKSIRLGNRRLWYNLHNMRFGLAISLLLFCNFGYRTHFSRWTNNIWFKLVWLSSRTSKIHRFDYCSLAKTGLFYWTRHCSLHLGDSCQSKIFLDWNVWIWDWIWRQICVKLELNVIFSIYICYFYFF